MDDASALIRETTTAVCLRIRICDVDVCVSPGIYNNHRALHWYDLRVRSVPHFTTESNIHLFWECPFAEQLWNGFLLPGFPPQRSPEWIQVLYITHFPPLRNPSRSLQRIHHLCWKAIRVSVIKHIWDARNTRKFDPASAIDSLAQDRRTIESHCWAHLRYRISTQPALYPPHEVLHYLLSVPGAQSRPLAYNGFLTLARKLKRSNLSLEPD